MGSLWQAEHAMLGRRAAITAIRKADRAEVAATAGGLRVDTNDLPIWR